VLPADCAVAVVQIRAESSENFDRLRLPTRASTIEQPPEFAMH